MHVGVVVEDGRLRLHVLAICARIPVELRAVWRRRHSGGLGKRLTELRHAEVVKGSAAPRRGHTGLAHPMLLVLLLLCAGTATMLSRLYGPIEDMLPVLRLPQSAILLLVPIITMVCKVVVLEVEGKVEV